jgi:hypothetical protein
MKEVNKYSKKATSKAGQLVDYRDNLLSLRTACKLKLPHLTEGGADLVKQNVQETLKKFQDTKNKEYEKHINK